VATHGIKRFFRHRQRQQIRKIGPADDAPCQMLGHHAWLDPLGDLSNTFQMPDVEAIRAAERKPYTMQGNGFVATNGIEITQRRSAAHVILGMDFHPRHVRLTFEHNLMVRKAQPDPGFRRNRAALVGGCRRHEPPKLQLALSLPP